MRSSRRLPFSKVLARSHLENQSLLLTKIFLHALTRDTPDRRKRYSYYLRALTSQLGLQVESHPLHVNLNLLAHFPPPPLTQGFRTRVYVS